MRLLTKFYSSLREDNFCFFTVLSLLLVGVSYIFLGKELLPLPYAMNVVESTFIEHLILFFGKINLIHLRIISCCLFASTLILFTLLLKKEAISFPIICMGLGAFLCLPINQEFAFTANTNIIAFCLTLCGIYYLFYLSKGTPIDLFINSSIFLLTFLFAPKLIYISTLLLLFFTRSLSKKQIMYIIGCLFTSLILYILFTDNTWSIHNLTSNIKLLVSCWSALGLIILVFLFISPNILNQKHPSLILLLLSCLFLPFEFGLGETFCTNLLIFCLCLVWISCVSLNHLYIQAPHRIKPFIILSCILFIIGPLFIQNRITSQKQFITNSNHLIDTKLNLSQHTFYSTDKTLYIKTPESIKHRLTLHNLETQRFDYILLSPNYEPSLSTEIVAALDQYYQAYRRIHLLQAEGLVYIRKNKDYLSSKYKDRELKNIDPERFHISF